RLVVLLGAAVVVALLAVRFSGAALPYAIGDPGELVRWGTPVTSALRNLLAAGTVGCLVLAVGILPRKAPAKAAARRSDAEVDGRAYPGALTLAGGFAVAWTFVSVLHLAFTYARAGRTRL